jgi:hypothetical protein
MPESRSRLQLNHRPIAKGEAAAEVQILGNHISTTGPA